ncbi:MAG: Ig-like domain-containing protein [Clostridia bacterium]|nr:Ig-like domain-containing protein [Clostridia bacterium]
MRKTRSKLFAILFLVALSCLCLVGCKKEDTSVPTLPQQQSTYSVELNESALSVNLFETAKLDVTAKKDGVVVANPSVEWKSENTEVATVDNGVITPVVYGTTVISVTYENVSASCQVTVADDGFVPSIVVDVEEVSLLITSEPRKVNASVFYDKAGVDTSSATITYSIPANGQAIATVDANGYVTPVGIGETTLTVSAVWKGYMGAGMTKTIPLSVHKDVEPKVLGGASEIYLSAVTIEGQAFSNTTTLTAEVYENNEKLQSPNVTWVSSDTSVATVVNGVVTAVAEGETLVYVRYDDGEDVFESNKKAVKVTLPVIDKTADLSFDLDKSKVEYNAIDATSVFGNSYAGDIVKVTVKSNTENLLTSNGVNVSTLSEGEKVFVVYNEDNYAFEVTAKVYTRILKTKADLQAFGSAYATTADSTNTNDTKSWRVILANDIDYENGNYCADAGYTTSDRWLGVFDGNGFAISNIKTRFGFFGWIETGAELKNTAFINVNKDSAYQGGLLANQVYGTIDNCFVQASNVVVKAKRTGGMVNTLYASGKISNCIAIVEFVEDTAYANATYNALAGVVENESSIINTYAISASAKNSYGSPNEATVKDTNLYRTVSAFKTAHPDLTAIEFENYGDFWLMTKGVPMHEDYCAILQTLAITNGETDVQVGSTLQITANFTGVTFILETEYEGVTLTSDGLLAVSQDALTSDITIKAFSPYSDDIFATKTISIISLIESTIEQSLGEIVLKKDGVALTQDYQISANGVSGTVTKIQTANTGTQITFTSDGTTITLNNADVQNAITAQDGGEFALVIYTSTHKYQAKVTVISLEISTKAGLDYFATTIYRGATNVTSNDDTNSTYGVYVRLTADIDYEGAEYPNDGSKYVDHNNYVWQGTFDGCGNVISNIGIRRGFFCIIGTLAEVKNLALTNVTNNYNYQFGVICNQVYGTIDNCFVQATITTTKAGASSATSKNRGGIFNAAYRGKNYSASITNCIAVVEFETEASNHYAIGRTIDGTSYGENAILENCYGISASTTQAVGTSADGLYASASLFQTSVGALPSGFNSHWTYTASGLSFGDTQVLTFTQA